jgi:hypothetical protein
MNEELFHTMAVAQQRYHMAYNDALLMQETSRNGTLVKETWDIVRDKEYLYKVAFDNYVIELMPRELVYA